MTVTQKDRENAEMAYRILSSPVFIGAVKKWSTAYVPAGRVSSPPRSVKPCGVTYRRSTGCRHAFSEHSRTWLSLPGRVCSSIC